MKPCSEHSQRFVSRISDTTQRKLITQKNKSWLYKEFKLLVTLSPLNFTMDQVLEKVNKAYFSFQGNYENIIIGNRMKF